MESKYLSVRNMHKYQHYRVNKPAWIKLYKSLWSEYEFFRLDDATKAHVIGLFILCSQHGNMLPFDKKYIETELRAKQPIDFQSIINSGFIVAHDGDSIKSLEKSYKKNAKSDPTEKEKEKYKEEKERNFNSKNDLSSHGANPDNQVPLHDKKEVSDIPLPVIV